MATVRPILRVNDGFPGSNPHLREDVRILQRELERRSYRVGTDGRFGSITEAAVKHFQHHSGLVNTGVVGPDEWRALLEGPVRNIGTSFTPPVSPGTEPAVIPDVPDSPSWLRVAKGEIGQLEVRGAAANPRIVEYHANTSLRATSDETAWCSSFMCWVLQQLGIAGTNDARAISWVDWGTGTTAQAGAITVLYNAAAANSSLTVSGNHCAFLVQETPAAYVMLGGNQDNSVKVKDFPKDKWELKAYRWPTGY